MLIVTKTKICACFSSVANSAISQQTQTVTSIQRNVRYKVFPLSYKEQGFSWLHACFLTIRPMWYMLKLILGPLVFNAD